MKSIIAASIIAMTTLVGCAQSSGELAYSKNATNKADLVAFGVPGLLGLTGSSFPVSETMSITASHVPSIHKVVSTHKDCDVKLIAQDNRGRKLPTFRNPNLGEHVHTYGYSANTVMPMEGEGVLLKNYTAPDSSVSTSNCIVTTSSAAGMQGMSGSAVYDDNGNVVGVLVAINSGSKEKFNTVVVPYSQIEKWLKEQMIEHK
jgi:hypothetical protein